MCGNCAISDAGDVSGTIVNLKPSCQALLSSNTEITF